MAQHTANREPTMEEILASIRRIIESNEASTGNADGEISDESEGPEPEMVPAGADTGQWPATQAGSDPADGDQPGFEDVEAAHFAEAGIEETVAGSTEVGPAVVAAGVDEPAETAMQSVTSASEEKAGVHTAEKTDDISVADVPAAQASANDSPANDLSGNDAPADDGSGGQPSMESPTPGRPVSLADVAARVRASGLRSLSGGGSRTASLSTASVAAIPANGSVAMRIEPAFEPQEADDLVDDEPEPVSESAWYSALPANDSVEAPVRAEFAGEADVVSESEFDVDIRDAVTAALGAETAREALSSAPLHAAHEDEDKPARESDADTASAHDDDARSTDGEGAAASLMSVDAGRKVSAAFDDLNDAFEAGGRRSFDDIAQDMLRPMLQEWLDDNLPTLVERLVRDEIERVARGGKR